MTGLITMGFMAVLAAGGLKLLALMGLLPHVGDEDQ